MPPGNLLIYITSLSFQGAEAIRKTAPCQCLMQV